MAQALMTLLKLDGILVRYGDRTILEVRSLDIAPGEILAILGPNGAGKSTLLRVMGLLERPAEGKVFFRGVEPAPRERLAVRRRMATVFQEPLLLGASVYANVALGLKLRGLDRTSIAARVGPWLERLGIGHLAARSVRTLSGGEAQRASLARALVLEPELLLLDEPFSSLDGPTREELLADLSAILRDGGMTTVFVTHDRNEAAVLADRVGVLIGGRLLQLGPTAEVFARPKNEAVARFVGREKFRGRFTVVK